MEKALKLKAQGNCYAVYWENGGEVPKALKGLYTSQVQAQQAITQYQDTKPTPKRRKVEPNGEKSG